MADVVAVDFENGALAGNYRVTFNPDGSLHAVPLEVTRG